MLFDKIISLSRQSLIYGAGHVLTRFISFLLLPFYSHHIPPDEYGALVLIYIFIAVMQVVYIAGLDIAFLKYYVAESAQRKKRIFSNSFFAMVGIALALTLFLFSFPHLITSLIFHQTPPQGCLALIRIACGILFFDTLMVIPFLRLRGDNKPTHFTILKLVHVVINITLNIVLVAFLHRGIAGALYANLAASAFTLVLLVPVVYPVLSLQFSFKVLKDLWRFGLPNVPALFFLYVIEFSDRKIIEAFHGLEEAGLYSAGYKMGMFMAIITVAFRFAWQPFFLAEAKNKGAEKTFARVFTYFFATAGMLFMIVVMFAGDFVMMKLPISGITILEKTYWTGMAVFPIICLAHFFDGLYANFTVGIYIKKKTHMVPLINGAGAVFNLGANLLVIPKYGMMGAAWTTLGSFMLMAGLLYIYINRHYPVPYEWGRVLKITLALGIFCGLYFLHPGGIIWRFALLIATPLLMAATGFFRREELQRMKMILRLTKR